MKGIKIQPTQAIVAVASHYRAQKDRALSDLELYLNRPTAVGGHSDVFDDLINIFEKLEHSNSMLEMVESMTEVKAETLAQEESTIPQGIGSDGDYSSGATSEK